MPLISIPLHDKILQHDPILIPTDVTATLYLA